MKEQVNHPDHYQSGNGMEVIDVIEGFELNFGLWNAVKYLLRAGKKDDAVQDLNKAIWYINREIRTIKRKKEEADKVKEMLDVLVQYAANKYEYNKPVTLEDYLNFSKLDGCEKDYYDQGDPDERLGNGG